MLQEKSQRRALAPLPINTMASKSCSPKDGKATRKRGIDEVDDLKPPPRATRVLIASQQTPDPGNQESQHDTQNHLRQDTSSAHSNSNPVKAEHLLKEEREADTGLGSNGSLPTIRHRGVKSEPVSSQATIATEMTPRQRYIANLTEKLCLRLRLAMFRIETSQKDVPFNKLQIPEQFPDLETFLRTLQNPGAPSKSISAIYTSSLVSRRQIASPPPAFSKRNPTTGMVVSNDVTPSTPRVKVRNASPAISASPNKPKAYSVSMKKERGSRDTSVSGEAASCLLDLKHQQN